MLDRALQQSAQDGLVDRWRAAGRPPSHGNVHDPVERMAKECSAGLRWSPLAIACDPTARAPDRKQHRPLGHQLADVEPPTSTLQVGVQVLGVDLGDSVLQQRRAGSTR
jgi:hypothetical protein